MFSFEFGSGICVSKKGSPPGKQKFGVRSSHLGRRLDDPCHRAYAAECDPFLISLEISVTRRRSIPALEAIPTIVSPNSLLDVDSRTYEDYALRAGRREVLLEALLSY